MFAPKFLTREPDLYRKKLIFAAKLIVSGAMIWYLLSGIGVAQATKQVTLLSVETILSILLLLCAYHLVAAFRWYMVLRALNRRISVMDAVRITFVAAFFNQFLPTSVGADAIRVWELYRSGIALGAAVNSVIIERAGYLLSLSLLAAGGANLVGEGHLPIAFVPILWIIFVAALGLTVALVCLGRFPPRFLPAAISKGAVRLESDSRVVYGYFRYSLGILISTFANQALLALAVFILARNLDVSVTAMQCIALLPAIQLITSLPISMAGWGVREFAMVTLFGYVGVPGASALVISIALAMFSIIAVIPGGMFWLVQRRQYSSTQEAFRLKDLI